MCPIPTDEDIAKQAARRKAVDDLHAKLQRVRCVTHYSGGYGGFHPMETDDAKATEEERIVKFKQASAGCNMDEMIAFAGKFKTDATRREVVELLITSVGSEEKLTNAVINRIASIVRSAKPRAELIASLQADRSVIEQIWNL
jgi:hypothetical protein